MRALLKIIKITIIALAACVLIAWLIGQIFSDQYSFTQWLLWIPTPIAIVFALASIACVIPRKPVNRLHKVRFICFLGITIAIALYFTFIEHHFYRGSAEDSATFKIIHFNANTANDDEFAHFNEDTLAHNADLIILTNSGHHKRYEKLTESYKANGRAIHKRPFRVFSRFEILEIRPIVANEGINVVLIHLDTTSKLGKPIVIYAVDMPSDPTLSRIQLAQKLRTMLNNADAPAPDIALGDFNMTRRGAALSKAFPELEHAYEQAGQGYGATFPRRLPLFHIDHILLAESLQAENYQLINPHAGRHMLQMAEISAK